jgi:preprotein translocase subunit SecD
MKKTSLLFLMTSLIVFSCTSGEKTKVQKASFGIFKTVKVSDIPGSIMDTLKNTNIRLADDLQLPVIGYMPRSDSLNLYANLSNEKIRLLKSYYSVDQEGKYQELIAVYPEPVMVNSDIQKARNKGQSVEIYFTLEGAKKWADMTRDNKGNSVAFVINDLVYSVPVINGEIKSGVALIGGLENEITAKKLSDSL